MTCQKVSQIEHQGMLKSMSQNMSDRMPDEMSDRTSDEMSVGAGHAK